MTTTLDYTDLTADANLSDVWDTLESPIAYVIDEHGCNVAGAQLRHFHGVHWLHVDNEDGYSILTDSEVADLTLVAERPDA